MSRTLYGTARVSQEVLLLTDVSGKKRKNNNVTGRGKGKGKVANASAFRDIFLREKRKVRPGEDGMDVHLRRNALQEKRRPSARYRVHVPFPSGIVEVGTYLGTDTQ